MLLQDAVVQLLQTFDKYAGTDSDSNTLSQTELLKMMKTEFPMLCKMDGGDAMLMKICTELDVNKDKKVDFREYGVFVISLSDAMRDMLHEGKHGKK